MFFEFYFSYILGLCELCDALCSMKKVKCSLFFLHELYNPSWHCTLVKKILESIIRIFNIIKNWRDLEDLPACEHFLMNICIYFYLAVDLSAISWHWSPLDLFLAMKSTRSVETWRVPRWIARSLLKVLKPSWTFDKLKDIIPVLFSTEQHHNSHNKRREWMSKNVEDFGHFKGFYTCFIQITTP